jgi:hypothetical protein
MVSGEMSSYDRGSNMVSLGFHEFLAMDRTDPTIKGSSC